MSLSTTPAFAELLATAVTQPGVLSSAYRQFHNYSLGNVLLAWGQCHAREIPLGSMATFPKWKELGRHVKRGETAITLCQPVTIKKKAADAGQDEEFFLRFTFRNRWFVLAQTEGADLPPADPPGWEKSRALAALDIAEIPFDAIDGNAMSYATGRQVSISPINPRPFKTLFHELAHVLLGHTAEAAQSDSETPRRVFARPRLSLSRCCAARPWGCQELRSSMSEGQIRMHRVCSPLPRSAASCNVGLRNCSEIQRS